MRPPGGPTSTAGDKAADHEEVDTFRESGRLQARVAPSTNMPVYLDAAPSPAESANTWGRVSRSLGRRHAPHNTTHLKGLHPAQRRHGER